MSLLKLTAHIESFNGAGYTAWIESDKLKGIVAHGNSAKEAFRELLISLKVKFCYDYGIEMSDFEEREIGRFEDFKLLEGDGKRDINLSLV